MEPSEDGRDYANTEPGPRILIISPAFHDYGRMISDGFRKCGCIVKQVDEVQPRLNLLKAIAWTSSAAYRAKTGARLAEESAAKVISSVEEWEPDICLQTKGALSSLRVLSDLKRGGTKLALWAHDTVARFPEISENASIYDSVFVFEPSDVEVLEREGIAATYLPAACDPEIYFPMNLEHRPYDIAFVGAIHGYKRRMRILRQLVKNNPDLSVRIWTNTPPTYSPRRFWKTFAPFSRVCRAVERQTLSHQQINVIYNSARICVNVHHDQSQSGVNPRTFEILGSGAFEIVDERDGIGRLFSKGEEIACFNTDEDLQSKIEHYMNHPDQRRIISERGRSAVVKHHSYERRAKRILDTLLS